MLRIRAASMVKVLSGTLIAVVVAFSAAFSYLLMQLTTEVGSASNFFATTGAMAYLTVEALFLALVIFGAYAVVRRKK